MRFSPPPPPLGQTPAYCCARSSRGSRGASTACARCLSHSANAQPNPGPAAHPLAFPVGGKGERAGQPQRPTGTLDPPGGVPQLRFNSWQGKKKAAAQKDSRGSWGLGNRVGWSANIRGEGRGVHWTEQGGQSPQERGTQGANAGLPRQQGRERERRGPGRRIWGRKDGQTAPKAGEGGRLRVLGARGGVPGGQERGTLSLSAEVQEGSAWRSSSRLGALDPKRPTWAGVVCGV